MEIAVWSMELQSMYWQWPCESWILQTRASKWTLSRYCFVKLSHLNFEKNNQKTLIATQTIFNTTKLQNCCYMVHPTLAILFLVCVWVYRAPFNSHTDPPLFSYTSLFYWLAAAQDVIAYAGVKGRGQSAQLDFLNVWDELTFHQWWNLHLLKKPTVRTVSTILRYLFFIWIIPVS